MAYRLMILLIVLMSIVSCSSQSISNIDVKALDLGHYVLRGKTVLMLAAERGDSTAVKKALQQGARMNSVSPGGTAFSLALINGHRSIARVLLSAGSNWQHGFEKNNTTALIQAASHSYNKLVKTLILRGAELNHIDDTGYSALAKTALNGHLTTLKILIKAGADVDVAPEGKSLLMHVVEANNMLLTILLIKAGADVNFKDEQADTALKIARRKEYFDLDLMLVQSGARH